MMSDEDFDRTRAAVEKHNEWLQGLEGGLFADFTGQDLVEAKFYSDCLRRACFRRSKLQKAVFFRTELAGAIFEEADLRDADFTGADLANADFTGADMRGVTLTGARLDSARLTPVRDSVWEVLNGAPSTAAGVLQALREGRIEGGAYGQGAGDCCLLGTVAKLLGCRHTEIPGYGYDCPAERFFLLIHSGHTPKNWLPSRMAEEWIEEWMKRREAV